MLTSSEKATFSGVTISSFSVGAMARSHLHFLDAALHVEVPLRHAVVHAVENLLEAAHRVRHCDLPPLAAGEHLRRRERLTEEALDLTSAINRQLVLRRELVHAQDRDDVLQVLEALQDLLHPPRHVVVLLPDRK